VSKKGQQSVLVVDLLGSIAVAACVFGCFRIALDPRNDIKAEITALRRSAKAGNRDLAALRAVCDHQRALLYQRQAELAKTGRLPDETPIEQYFQTLSELASQHGLKVLGQHPVSPRRYPGLLEQRYGYDLNGSFPDIARFLRAVEETDFWADISYLKVEQGAGQPMGVSNERAAALTISLFSALPVEPRSESG